jgi:hypothetical protein
VPYQQQPYAFLYRKQYNPACVRQLQDGLATLSANASVAAANGQTGGALAIGLYSSTYLNPGASIGAATAPVPQQRLRPTEDPETMSNRHGSLDPGRVEAVARAGSHAAGIRVVGAGYYNDILDEQKRRAAGERAAKPSSP